MRGAAGALSGSASAEANYVTFDVKNAIQTTGGSINDNGYIGGWYTDSGTQTYVVNDSGMIVGGYLVRKDSTDYVGFVRTPDGKITTFDPHKSGWVLELGLNNHGAITGGYAHSYTQGVQHGFLLTQ